MSMLQTIKDASLVARKAKGDNAVIAKNLLITLLGELESRSKRDGIEVTDELVVNTVKRFLISATDTLALVSGLNEESASKSKVEIAILEKFLPQQMTEEEIGNAIRNSNAKTLGEAMAMLKSHYAGKYDGKLASSVAKSLFM